MRMRERGFGGAATRPRSSPRPARTGRRLTGRLLVAALVVGSCGDPAPALDARFAELPSAPGAVTYTGPAKNALELRLVGLLDDRDATLGGSRIELLPAGVTWDDHVAWTAAHAGGRTPLAPAPTNGDPQRLQAEFAGDDDRLILLGTIEAERVVAFTALTDDR